MAAPQGREHAILDSAEAREQSEVGRAEPGPGLSPYVDYLWWVRWRADRVRRTRVLPAPVVHVSAELLDDEPRLLVVGVQRSVFTRDLTGSGHVVAAAFRPGGFHPFLRGRVADLTGRQVPLADVLGTDDRPVARALLAEHDVEAGMDRLAGWLEDLRPDDDPLAVELADLVGVAEHDRTVTRAADLAARAGVGLRTLQRQFATYVGIGPKWVVQRFRLLDVAAAANGGEPVDWAGLAADLGFSDQAHLVRAFTAVVGQPPASYRREVWTGRPTPAGRG